MKIILVSGYIASGKDVLGDIIVKNYKDYLKINLADKLKDIVSEKYKVPIEDLYTQEGKKKFYNSKLTYRDLLIDEGQFQRRKDPYIWVKKVCQKIDENPSKNIVICDFRFGKEYKFIKERYMGKYEVKTIRVSRKTADIIFDDTEIDLIDFRFDHYILNDFKTIEELEKLILSDYNMVFGG